MVWTSGERARWRAAGQDMGGRQLYPACPLLHKCIVPRPEPGASHGVVGGGWGTWQGRAGSAVGAETRWMQYGRHCMGHFPASRGCTLAAEVAGQASLSHSGGWHGARWRTSGDPAPSRDSQRQSETVRPSDQFTLGRHSESERRQSHAPQLGTRN